MLNVSFGIRPLAVKIAAAVLVFAALRAGAAGTWTPDPSIPVPELHRRLYELGRHCCEMNFDSSVNLVSQKKDHLIRESIYYAYALLLSGDPGDRARALAILRSVLTFQDTRPNSQWRGAFLWRTSDHWETIKNHWRTDLPAPEYFRIGFCIDESNETLPGNYPYAHIHFNSNQVKDAALVVLSSSTALPGQGGCQLVFSRTAVADTSKSPIVIRDGSITTYVYPVTNVAAPYATQIDTHTVRLTRAWTTADKVRNLHLVSYLVVFRASQQPPPAVSKVSVRPDSNGVVAHAEVDAVELSVASLP
jgi:hypothetical protein